MLRIVKPFTRIVRSTSIADINSLLEGAPVNNMPTLSPVHRERKVKGRSLIHFSLSPDPAAVSLDDALDYGQADAGAFVFRANVQALENPVQIVGKLFIKPHTVVFNVIDSFLALGGSAHLDDCGLPATGKFDGIG
jgi:hypothetical protein